MTTYRYYSAAVILSALWIPVLRVFLLTQRLPWSAMPLFVVAGVITAGLYRKLVVGAEGFANIMYGATIPFIAAEIFAMICVVAGFVASALPSSRPSDPFMSVLLIFFVPLAALKAAYVVVPFGILVQFLMRWAGSEPRQEVRQ